MRRVARAAGTAMVLAGVLVLVWAGIVWRWEDPFTGLVTRYEQQRLEDAFEEALRTRVPRPMTAPRPNFAALGRDYRRSLERGEVVGRLEIPRLDLEVFVVNGTDSDTLKRGPGRYIFSFVPGEGRLIYIAGHRTTYGAPFSHIDRLRRGDHVTVELPYATFEYRVARHRIVEATATEVLRSRDREELALQACHPRFFATHRYLVYATPFRVTPRGGTPVAVAQASSR